MVARDVWGRDRLEDEPGGHARAARIGSASVVGSCVAACAAVVLSCVLGVSEVRGQVPISAPASLATPESPHRFGTTLNGMWAAPSNVMDGDGLTEGAPRFAEPLDAQCLRDLGVPIGTSAAHVTRTELAAAGFVYINPLSGSSIRKLRHGFYDFHYRHEGLDESGVVEMPSLVEPRLHVDLAHDGDGVRYSYRVENGATARQTISLIVIEVPDGSAVSATSADDTYIGAPRLAGLPRTGWLPFGAHHGITPGGTMTGLQLESRSLPAMTRARLSGNPVDVGSPHPDFPDDLASVSTQLTSEEDGVVVATLGPVLTPGPWTAEQGHEAVVRLRSDVDLARAAGFVSADDASRLGAALDAAQSGSRANVDRARATVDELASLDPGYRSALGVVLGEAIAAAR